jgi:putative nucleotidyltransferase with HDIG domain
MIRETYEHTLTVVKEAVRIARLFDADQTLASQAALLHDVEKRKDDLFRYV